MGTIGTSSETICTSDGTNVATIKFITDLGNLPLLSYSTTKPIHSVLNAMTFTTSESIEGNKVAYECSNAGQCDRSTGLCKCYSGFTSSNGQNQSGRRGDCGFMDAHAKGLTGSIGNTMMLSYSQWPF